MRQRMLASFLMLFTLPVVGKSQPARLAKPALAVATSDLTLASVYNHQAEIRFTVTSGGSASERLCTEATLTPPVTTRSVACGAIAPGNSLTVVVQAASIDRCEGRTGPSLMSCASMYSAVCPPGPQTRCRYHGGFRRSLSVTAPLVAAGQPLRLVLVDPTTLSWR